MPRYYPTIPFDDCWASVGNYTFYHRDGKCYYRKKSSPSFPGTDAQLDQASVHHRALEAWRSIEHQTQLIWNKYALTVQSHRPPYINDHHISGYNLFVSAYHGFAQLGMEHVPEPQPMESFPVFTMDFVSAALVEESNLLINFRLSMNNEPTPARFRPLLKLQLERPGRGKNPGLMRNYLALQDCGGDGSEISFLIPDFKRVWGLDLPSYRAHIRYLLLDRKTGYRCLFKQKSFDFSY